MKLLLTVFIGFLFLSSCFSQTLIDEYTNVSEHEDAYRLERFANELSLDGRKKGLLLLYIGNDSERIGNVKGYFASVKTYLKYFEKLLPSSTGFSVSQVKFVVVKGEPSFRRRLWIIGADQREPKYEEVDYNFKTIRKPVLFARTCLNCDGYPTDPKVGLVDWELLSRILKNNMDYLLRIELRGNFAFGDDGKTISVKRWIKKLRRSMSEEGIEKRRIILKRLKQGKGVLRTETNFYIVPK